MIGEMNVISLSSQYTQVFFFQGNAAERLIECKIKAVEAKVKLNDVAEELNRKVSFNCGV